MRILHVVKDLGFNGAAVVVSTLMKGQADRGHDVAAISEGGGMVERTPGDHFEMPPTGRDPRFGVPAIRALRRTIKEFRPDIVHAHNPNIMLLTGLATRRGRMAPAIVTLHGSPLGQYRLNALAAKVAGLPLIACGPAVARLMAESGHPVQATILNGVEIRPPGPLQHLRADLGLADGDFAFLQVGRLTEQKDPLLAVESLAAAGMPNAHLLYAGTGELRGDLERRIAELGIADRVHLLGDRKDAHDLMRVADAVLLCSNWEGHPLVLLEALRLGRPVVATRVPGIAELLNDRQDGLLCDKSGAAIAQGMRLVHDDAALRDRIAAGALARSEELHPDRMTDLYLLAYQRAIDASI